MPFPPALEEQTVSPAAAAFRSLVRQQATRRLHAAGYLALRGLDCSFERGQLHIRGRLPSYYLKQIALAVVADIEGVSTIIDQIRIHSEQSVARLVDRLEQVHGPNAPGVPPLAEGV